MRSWRNKLIFLLVVYFAGFATAIYCLAPVTDKQSGHHYDKGFPHSAVKSDEFAKSFNVKMREYLDYGKDAAHRAGAYLKQKDG
jgi:hypothetical protein